MAPTHVLIVTRAEIEGLSTLPEVGDHMHILNAAKKIAEKEKSGAATGWSSIKGPMPNSRNPTFTLICWAAGSWAGPLARAVGHVRSGPSRSIGFSRPL